VSLLQIQPTEDEARNDARTLPRLPPQPGSTFLTALSNSFSLFHGYRSCDCSRESVRHYSTPWTRRERAEVLSLPFLAQEHVLSMGWTWERFGTHIVQPPICAQGKQVVELPLQHLPSLKTTKNKHSPSMEMVSSTNSHPRKV